MVMKLTGIPEDPLSRFSLSIFRLNGLLMWNGDRITGSIGQSSARWQVLGRVGYQPQTVAQMAREMGHARQSVQRLAAVLAKEGLDVRQALHTLAGSTDRKSTPLNSSHPISSYSAFCLKKTT